MLNVQKSFALVSAIMAVSIGSGALAQTAPAVKSATLGVVDRDKVITSFNKAQSAAEELKKTEESVRKLLEDSNKQYEEAKNAKKPPAELEGLQKRLQTKIDDEYKKAQAKAQNLETQLETDIDSAIKAEAASRKLDTVLMKGAVLLGGTDITEGVVKRLGSSASAAPAPTEAPKAAVVPAAKPAAAPPAKPAAAGDQSTLRVSIEKVDQLINLVGELVITQAMLAQNSRNVDPGLYQQLTSGLADLERNTRDLQEAVMSIRMIPMSVVFNRFPRMLRDLAAKLGKKVELVTQGEATELDKGLVEKITDPLTHLVRNSCDHGIEMPAERAAKGKPETGTITLVASHQGGSIVIEVRDDGKGLNRQKLISKAQEKGIDAHEGMSDSEVWNLIFAPGFSTAEQVTDVSGRGVGMDVVKRNITSLGGHVEIDSAEGYGMKVSVRLPLTLAIMDGMSVGVGEEVYILPLSSVVESFQVKQDTVKTVAGSGRVVEVRDEFMPVIELEKVFEVPRFDFEHVSNIMVVVEAEGGRVALLVDELLGQQQVVVKNLEANYRKVSDVSGATIMGDGRVALILDIGSLVRKSRH